MNTEAAKAIVTDYLRHIKAIRLGMDTSLDNLREHLETMGDVRVKLSDVHTPNVDTEAIPRLVEKLFELVEAAEVAVENDMAEYNRARAIFSTNEFRKALWLHTVEGMKWFDIGFELGYHWQYALKRAYRECESVIDDLPSEWRNARKAI